MHFAWYDTWIQLWENSFTINIRVGIQIILKHVLCSNLSSSKKYVILTHYMVKFH